MKELLDFDFIFYFVSTIILVVYLLIYIFGKKDFNKDKKTLLIVTTSFMILIFLERIAHFIINHHIFSSYKG
jgi:hypothetical protein